MKKERYKSLELVIKLIILIVCIPCLFINSIIIVDSYLHPNEIPSFFGYKPLIVLSSSMEEKMAVGDIAIVKKTNENKLNVDDIIAFKDSEDVIVTHRIVGIQNDGNDILFVTKSDNNIEDQTLVNSSSIEGKYLFKIPGLGNIALYLQSSFGFITVLLISIVIFLIYLFVINLHNDIEEIEP